MKMKEGMRVILIKGTDEEGKDPNIMTWIAGSVSVGSIGTLYFKKADNLGWTISWDKIAPKTNWVFNIGHIDILPEYLKQIVTGIEEMQAIIDDPSATDDEKAMAQFTIDEAENPTEPVDIQDLGTENEQA